MFENGTWHSESFREKQFVSISQVEFLFLTGIRQLEIAFLLQVCVRACVWGGSQSFHVQSTSFSEMKVFFNLLFNSITKYLIMLVLRGLGILSCQFGFATWKFLRSLYVRYCSIINSWSSQYDLKRFWKKEIIEELQEHFNNLQGHTRIHQPLSL